MADQAAPEPVLADQPLRYGKRASEGRFGTRAISLAIALLIEALIVLLLLMVGWSWRQETDLAEELVTFEASDFSADEPAPPEEAPAETANSSAEPTPVEQVPERVQEPTQDTPNPAPIVREPPLLPPRIPLPTPVQPPKPPAAAPPSNAPPRVYGPPDTGPPNSGSDSQRVGTASNGQPLYAARWYREPTRGELAGYLSTASGPGSALIACRTVPDFYVEDCELIGETPRGSQIGRAVLAAAWQFRVRPARIGGRSQVGSWVRIRIDYTQTIRR